MKVAPVAHAKVSKTNKVSKAQTAKKATQPLKAKPAKSKLNVHA